jgi:hypothetical protein
VIGRPLLRFGSRNAPLGLALVLLTAVPGVAIASLPAQPPPTHACCQAPGGMPADGECETAPCCIQKPAPRAPSVLTGALELAPAALVAPVIADAAPAAPEAVAASVAVVPRARSAPLFLLLATLLI